MRHCIEIPRNNLWFGERGCLPVWLTNQQPIRFLQLSFPLSVSLPGTGQGRWIHTRIRHKCNPFFRITKGFFLILAHFHEKIAFLMQDSRPEPVYLCG